MQFFREFGIVKRLVVLEQGCFGLQKDDGFFGHFMFQFLGMLSVITPYADDLHTF